MRKASMSLADDSNSRPETKDTDRSPSRMVDCVVAEMVGTFILVFFGCGSVHAAVLWGAQSGVWQVAIVWGIAIMLAIYLIGGVSGAHINPAITLAFSVWTDFPKRLVGPYIGAQMCGAFLAAAVLFMLFSGQLKALEAKKSITRGAVGSQITASCYGEFYPNPGGLAAGDEPFSEEEYLAFRKTVSHSTAFFAELLGTAILAAMVFGLTDKSNVGAPNEKFAPVFIGLTVSILISVIAPLTQACFNPARDFGPRLFSAFAGWGQVALPLGTDWSWLTVYVFAPILGGIIGGGFYYKLIQPMLRRS